MDTDTLTLNNIISESLKNSMTYAEYRTLVTSLVDEKSNTGSEKTEALAEYTQLNDRRMRRWDKTGKVSEEMKSKIQNSDKKITWLVISESWCGDAAHIMPIINKVAELNDAIDYKVVLRDENEALMDQFLTNGGKAIPKLVMLDSETNEVLNTFGPRPTVATKLVQDYKSKHGKLTPEFKEDLQRWYNKDKGQSTIEDLVNLLG
ncbi:MULTISPECIES: thioredoxin family protein [Winogradskyella]|uniref:thioredoxin family protein n=1 Tax=Winogradskyella TaxID=286104 RepID=UPI0015CEB09A|nr:MULTISPECIES: thioredoxin family protein [Winogradskyella]QNK76638.1 thioredoxin family protein [Winogradskyella sp. PAMC22761]QXP77411.1 thioredoxin family protein [Winogradskyella sp. HaHa_3_26]